MLIDDADKPAKWYFALEAGAAGRGEAARRPNIPWTAQ